MTNKISEFEKYLNLRYSKSTAKQYLWAMKSFTGRLETQEDIDGFLLEKVYNNKNNPFYKGFLKAYIRCFKLPFRILRSRRKSSRFKKDYKFLTKEQVYKIIDTNNLWISLLTRLFFETGLRLRELIDMDRKGIDIDTRTLSGTGKGNKPFRVSISRKSARILAEYLKKYTHSQPFHLTESGKDYARSYYYYLKKFAAEEGVYKVHPHRLRHALGHHLRVDKKWDLQQIKVALRHSKLETTGIYTDATIKEVRDKMDKEVFENGDG